MTEEQLRAALRHEVADLTAPPTLLDGVRAKHRRRSIRNRSLAAGAVAVALLATLPFLPDGGGTPAEPITTPAASRTPDPTSTPPPEDIVVGRGAWMGPEDAEEFWDMDDVQLTTEGIDEQQDVAPGTYALAARCEAKRPHFMVRLELLLPGKTVDLDDPMVKAERHDLYCPDAATVTITVRKAGELYAFASPYGPGPAAITWRLYKVK